MSLGDDLRRDVPAVYPKDIPDYMLGAPEGWRAILYLLSRRIEHESIKVLQVKEKFGGLRFYFDDLSHDAASGSRVADAVRDAEEACLETCDRCGDRGVLRARPSGWLMVRCREHGEGALPFNPSRCAGFTIRLCGGSNI